jgi:hypothetical protein
MSLLQIKNCSGNWLTKAVVWYGTFEYTGFGKNNGTITDTVHMSLLIWCWTTLYLQYSHNSSWNALIQVVNSLWWNLIHSSWRMSSSYFRDVEGGNLFLTLISRTNQNGSMMLEYGDCADQGRYWSSPSCSSNHDWTVPAVWIGALSFSKKYIIVWK